MIRGILVFLIFCGANPLQEVFAQRLSVNSASTYSEPSNIPASPSAPDLTDKKTDESKVLKTYPDGTKKVVPVSDLNLPDDGKAFGGPPELTPYLGDSSQKESLSQEKGAPTPTPTVRMPSSIDTALRASEDSIGGLAATTSSGASVAGGATPDPMGGGSAPIDPLSGSTPNNSPPPLQTVSGKPAPVSSLENTIELGTYDDFFMNAAIGGTIQRQLTATRVFNGTNMQAYPYTYTNGTLNGSNVSSESFTFNPGFRFDVEFGYNIYDWLGVSLQTGIIYNGLDQYNVTLDGNSYHLSADGELVQVPVQLDVILRWPGAQALKPFIGGGVGTVWQQLDVNTYYADSMAIQGNYCRSAFQFGFNGQVGANYTVAPGLDFYGVFKLLGAVTPRIGNYDFENTYNFAVEVGVQSRF